jgi:hypothetical protein
MFKAREREGECSWKRARMFMERGLYSEQSKARKVKGRKEKEA